MGAKKILPAYQIVGGSGTQSVPGTMTGTATILSQETNVQNLDNVGIQVSWTGTPAGTISVLASVDNSSFFSLTFNPSLTQPSGSSGGYLINLNQIPYPYIKLQYVNASGSGVLSAFIVGKDLN